MDTDKCLGSSLHLVGRVGRGAVVARVVAAVAGVGRLRGAGRVVGGAGPGHHARPGPGGGGVPGLGVARPPRTVEGGAGGAGGARRAGGRGVGVVLGVEVEESAAEAGVAGAGVVGGGCGGNTEVSGGMHNTDITACMKAMKLSEKIILDSYLHYVWHVGTLCQAATYGHKYEVLFNRPTK